MVFFLWYHFGLKVSIDTQFEFESFDA